MTRRWRDLYEQQAELARGWLEGQAKFARTFAGLGAFDDPESDAGAMAELWRSGFALGGSLGQSLPGMADPESIAGEALDRFLNPMSLALVGGSQVGEAIRRMTEGPRFADLGAIERRMAGVMELWLAAQAAARAYETVVAGAWVEANQRFARELQARYGAGAVPQPKEPIKLWLDLANQTLLETHRSPRFLEAQRELLRHGMDFLLAQREMVEDLVGPAGLPTRTELDEVHRSVHELKRRLRALEKAAAQEASDEHPAPGARATSHTSELTTEGDQR
jgi:hypothetical protein